MGQINFIAVLVAAMIPMVIGGLWYSPVLFAKQFVELLGKTEEDLKKNFNPARDYGLMFACSLLMSFVLAYILSMTLTASAIQGMQLGVMIWLGFIVATNSGTVIFEGRKSGLYVINMVYYLVCLLIMSGLLAVWR